MVEKGPISAAAILQKTRKNVAIINAPSRHESTGGFPPLLKDTRENHLIRTEGEQVNIYAKPVAGPYTGREGNHFLIVPDAKDGRNVPSIQDLSSADLGLTLEMAESVAYRTLMEEGIDEVDFGFHSSRADQGKPKQRNNTFPDHLHFHVTGYAKKELQEVPSAEIIQNPDLLGKTGEALSAFTEELLMNEIIPELSENSDFDSMMTPTRDKKGRLRFKMVDGFSAQVLPEILQTIDMRAKEVYDDVAKCFFKVDDATGQYVEKDDQYRRYELLPLEDRRENLTEYFNERPYLSRGAKTGLRLLNELAQDADTIMERELAKPAREIDKNTTDYRSGSPEQQAANRFFAYKDLAYTMVWSAQKREKGQVEWQFGFDPMIFTVEGVPQSSSFTDKIILKQQEAFTEDELSAVRLREERIVDAVIGENVLFYQRGKSPSQI